MSRSSPPVLAINDTLWSGVLALTRPGGRTVANAIHRVQCRTSFLAAQSGWHALRNEGRGGAPNRAFRCDPTTCHPSAVANAMHRVQCRIVFPRPAAPAPSARRESPPSRSRLHPRPAAFPLWTGESILVAFQRRTVWCWLRASLGVCFLINALAFFRNGPREPTPSPLRSRVVLPRLVHAEARAPAARSTLVNRAGLFRNGIISRLNSAGRCMGGRSVRARARIPFGQRRSAFPRAGRETLPPTSDILFKSLHTSSQK